MVDRLFDELAEEVDRECSASKTLDVVLTALDPRVGFFGGPDRFFYQVGHDVPIIASLENPPPLHPVFLCNPCEEIHKQDR
jgi:hypothetical protein